jgi:type IV secretion system protein VirB10
LAQGKIIDAVLETAINTDLSGILRAVVSRDVYAEQGRRILVPKGSRLVGSYDTQIKRGQSRIFVIWNRVITPNGIDMIINSPGSDQLGRAGVEGKVDNKYFEVFGNSILLSTISVAFAFATEEITGADGLSEQENTTGSITTTGSPSDVAVVNAIEDFGSVVNEITQDVVSIKPTITVDQGTRLKVFVNKDVVFPSDLQSGRVNIIR